MTPHRTSPDAIQSPLDILVVDDEPDLRELIDYNLAQLGHRVQTAGNGLKAIEMIESSMPDIVILDVMMPGLTGIEVAQRLRAGTHTSSIPIIMLTAKAQEAHELEGLNAGADDYITKPFSMDILIARVHSLTRRTLTEPGEATELTLGGVSINLPEHLVRVDGQEIHLTITEYRLLVALVQSKGTVLSRAELISQAIGPAVTVTPRTVDVHITALRKKLGEHAGFITTVRAVGYRACDPDSE